MALEDDSEVLGLVESALCKVKEASYVFTKCKDQVVRLKRMEYIDQYGVTSEIVAPRELINSYKTDFFRKKQSINEVKKQDLEKRKSLSIVAREVLKQSEIPTLYVSERNSNIVEFLEVTYSCFLALNKNSPQHIGSFLVTMKIKYGPLKEAV